MAVQLPCASGGLKGTALLTTCEMQHWEIDLALKVFAGEIRQKQTVKSEKPGGAKVAAVRLRRRICHGMEWIDAALQQGGFVQNSAKLEVVPACRASARCRSCGV